MSEKELKMLDELLDSESGLSGWELDFIESLDNQRESELSEKQANKLESIWDRVNA